MSYDLKDSMDDSADFIVNRVICPMIEGLTAFLKRFERKPSPITFDRVAPDVTAAANITAILASYSKGGVQ